MASLPLSLLTVLLLAKILRIDFTAQKEHFLAANHKIYLSVFMLIFILILPTYAYATKQRNSVWKTNLSLFEHDLKYMEMIGLLKMEPQ